MEQQGKLLKDCSVTELKAIGYDLIAQLENTQKNLQVVNDLIRKKIEPEPLPEVKNDGK